ncbi:MAG: queuosine precursor transporter [Candidatus Nanohaloarchaeota archaeon]|nr:queuosine precursor transporter [Candidatus Nanohaloarchaeota archaeon]
MVNDLILYSLILIAIIAGNVVLFAYFSARYKSKSFLFAALATYLVVANIIAFRLVKVGPAIIPSAIIIYSLTFLISDFLSEKFGKKEAKQAIIAGFVLNILVVVVTYFITKLPYPEFAQTQAEIFSQVFSYTPRIVIGSLIAYIVSQHISIHLYHALKTKTKGKYMWLRNNLSTWTAQLFDTLLFITIAFYGILPFNVLQNMIFYHYLAKIIIAVLDTPFLYASTYIYDKFSISKQK